MKGDEQWTVTVEGPRSFVVRGPVPYDAQYEFLERLKNDTAFRDRLESSREEAHAALSEHGITVSPDDTIPDKPTAPPKDKIDRALADLQDAANSRSQVKGLLFAILHG
jgi:hypothetical protein